MIEVVRTSNENIDFTQLVALLDAHLWELYPATQAEYDTYNVIEKNNTVVIAYAENEAIGCGCFKKLDEETVEIKRMFVKPENRGLGVSHLVLGELEAWASELGFKFALLETLDKQIAAIALYQKRGYEITQNYGPYVDLEQSICMKKELSAKSPLRM